MKRLIVTAALAFVGAAAVSAQDVPPGTPTQGTPPATNVPSAAMPDTGTTAAGDTGSTAGAPVTKPMAGTAGMTTTDTNAPDPESGRKKHKRHAK